ncbi:MAG: hypothetical protein Q8N90_01745 [bacterium]|nr:hypothetical protein [bacterium]
MLYGNKAKIGLIVVAHDVTIEPDFYALKPEGVSIHATRVLLSAGTVEAEKKMLEAVDGAALLLARARVDIIVFGCASGSSVEGVGGDRRIIERIEKLTSTPATTPTTALLKAFQALGVTKIAVSAPYNQELTMAVVNVLNGSGLQVVNVKFGSYGLEMGSVPPEVVYQQSLEADKPEAEAIFISCTNFKALPIIEKLEKKLKKPVVASNAATMWETLRRINLRHTVKGYGMLLAGL